MLAALNGLTLAIAGHPWSITWGFTLWAAKLAQILGWDPAASPFWSGQFAATALSRGLGRDVTSVMNGGIILGAMMAAGLAGRFAPGFRLPLKSLAAALIGGLMMGYGARIAFGCNIGAFFSGVASTSVHATVDVSALGSISDLQDVEQLRTMFSQDDGEIRLVLLLSPT